nr:NAD(P)-binding domain-containing protein [Rhodococcus sp. 15-725-2-2b]
MFLPLLGHDTSWSSCSPTASDGSGFTRLRHHEQHDLGDRNSSATSAKSMSYIDAPIAGRVRRAYSGLTPLMVGANDEDFTRAEPLLNTITSKVFHLGLVGVGHAAEPVNSL